MNQRQIDLALLAGIGILLVTILVLALSAAPMSARGDIDDPVAEGAPAQREVPQETAEESAETDPAGGQVEESTEATPSPTVSEPSADEGDEVVVAQPQGVADADPSEEAVGEVPVGEVPVGEVPVGEVPVGEEAAGEGTTEGAVAVGTPEGEALERVGFAFVTGSLGACGVPLEPWQHVAVSRDLLERYGCGATVIVTLDDEIAGRRQVTAQIADTMGPEVERTLNVFVAEDEPALDYGVTGGTLSASTP